MGDFPSIRYASERGGRYIFHIIPLLGKNVALCGSSMTLDYDTKGKMYPIDMYDAIRTYDGKPAPSLGEFFGPNLCALCRTRVCG